MTEEERKEKQRAYYQKNKERCKKYSKEYSEEYRRKNIDKEIKLYEINRESKSEKNKRYYQERGREIYYNKVSQKETISKTCPRCGIRPVLSGAPYRYCKECSEDKERKREYHRNYRNKKDRKPLSRGPSDAVLSTISLDIIEEIETKKGFTSN